LYLANVIVQRAADRWQAMVKDVSHSVKKTIDILAFRDNANKRQLTGNVVYLSVVARIEDHGHESRRADALEGVTSRRVSLALVDARAAADNVEDNEPGAAISEIVERGIEILERDHLHAAVALCKAVVAVEEVLNLLARDGLVIDMNDPVSGH
jgi:hypothetical protein